MNIAILGFDREGRASYEYFKERGHDITICDQNEALETPDGVATVLGEGYLDNLDRFDVLVRTAGMPPQHILERNPGVADKITTCTNEFLRATPTKNIIGVTGTKGKGTTSTLITRILTQAGKRVFLGGNIGLAALSFIEELQETDWVVLELSSFQLSDMAYSPRIGVCLMVVPEHLDWHGDMTSYIQAKKQLFVNQNPNDIAIYYADNEISHDIASTSPGYKLTYYAPPGAYVENDEIKIDNQTICRTGELQLIGTHNWQNVCAAVTAVWQAGVMDTTIIHDAVVAFSGLPFRIEFRSEKNGIRYYNDSFATGPGAGLAAIAAITGPKIMIIGGYDRGLGLHELAETLSDSNHQIRHILLIGASAQRMANVLESVGNNNFVISSATNMQDIVSEATRLATSGDAVVLSPAFASFGLFKNFEDRGEKFNDAVESL